MKQAIRLIFLLLAGHFGHGQSAPSPLQCPDQFKAQTITIPSEGDLRCDEFNGDRYWTITRPAINQRLTDYPDITFKPGQIVSIVDVHGYVNVGAATNKWKKYDAPEDDFWSTERDIDRLYHGLIWIPGARLYRSGQTFSVPAGTAPVRILGVRNPGETDEFYIGKWPAEVDQYLRLGYESVDYSQNSYACATKPGSSSCTPRDPASIRIKISNAQVARNPSNLLKPFDALSDKTDVNGFMLSPVWAGNAFLRGEQVDALVECKSFPYQGPLLGGHDAFLYLGAGIQTFRDRSVSLRVSLGDMILPGTGEHAIQITIGPELRFNFKKRTK